jgi:DNA polymerase III delta prime subunit
MTYIIIGKNIKIQREKTLEIINEINSTNISQYSELISIPDIHILSSDEDSIKIEQARDFIQTIKYKPFEYKYQFGIVENADILTTEAQNSILKTLEEQNDHTNIIMQVSKSSNILDTILSRGRKIYIKEEADLIENYTLKITNTDLIEKFKQVEVLSKKTKTEILYELSSMSSYLSTMLSGKEKYDMNILHLIKELEKAYKGINSNGNKKLVLENLVVQTSKYK